MIYLYSNFSYLIAYLATKQKFKSPIIPTSNTSSVPCTGANVWPELEEALRSAGSDHPARDQLDPENRQGVSAEACQGREGETCSRGETRTSFSSRGRDVHGRFLNEPRAGEFKKNKTSEEKQRDQLYSKVAKWKKGATRYMQKIQKAT